MFKKFTVLLFVSIGTLALVVTAIIKDLSEPFNLDEPEVLEVVYGDSVYNVATRLEQKGLLDNKRLWIWYARLMGYADKIKAGEYEINRDDSLLAFLDKIVQGKVVSYQVTILEGWTTKQAIEALHQAEGVVKTLDPSNHQEILAAVGADSVYKHSEGIFYPDTYQFSKGTLDRDILKIAYKRLYKDVEEVWAEAKDKKLPYNSAYELLIMASIIEKETAVDAEREQIAGVFVNRLNKGMKLQTDPTVIYGMGDSYDGNIRKKDLTTPTPYNTYTMYGLPPTPIALPTKRSLEAAANPLLNEMIFFVGKGDGYHYFSATLEEHNRAVREYQLKRKDNYTSTPGQK